jgi:hypothetical protein
MNTNVDQRNGSALLTVLGIVAVVSVVCAMLGATATTQTRSCQITRDMLKARMIAESGMNKAYNAIKGNFALASGYTLSETFGGGSYKVRAVPLASSGPDRAQLFAEGTCGLGHVVVAADLENREQKKSTGSDDTFFFLPFDLISGGDMQLSGNFGAHVTTVFANGKVDLSGSSDVDATEVGSAQSIEWKKMPTNVTLETNQPQQEIFTAALQGAINDFIAYARQNGAVYDNAASIPFAPPGGVAYCTGPDTGWSGDGKGTFIFAGMFTSKHLNVVADNGYPSLIVLSPSSLQLNAGTVQNGAVILPSSSLKFNGHAEIDGPLLVGQSISGLGTADLFEGAGQGFNLPPKTESDDYVVITAWH